MSYGRFSDIWFGLVLYGMLLSSPTIPLDQLLQQGIPCTMNLKFCYSSNIYIFKNTKIILVSKVIYPWISEGTDFAALLHMV